MESGGKVSAKVKKIIINKLLSLPDFRPGTIYGVTTNVKVRMAVTSENEYILIR